MLETHIGTFEVREERVLGVGGVVSGVAEWRGFFDAVVDEVA